MSDPLSNRPEARKDQTRQMIREAAEHLLRLADRTDLSDHDFEGCLGLEILLLTNARQHWKKATEEKTHTLALMAQHRARFASAA
jgi:hypothetical protein